MKAAKSITAAAAALAITAASVCPIYADTESVQDTPAASTTSNVYSGFAVADLTDDSYCNVREDADINSQIVGVFHQGCVAEVVGEKDGWTEIASGNVTGYIRSDLLATGSDVDALLSSGEYTSYARVTAPTLNVRSGAGTDNDIIGQYGDGEKLHLLGYQDGWYQVDYDGETGYVSADWLRAGDGAHCAMTPDEYQAYLTAIEEGAQDNDHDFIIDAYAPSDDTENTVAADGSAVNSDSSTGTAATDNTSASAASGTTASGTVTSGSASSNTTSAVSASSNTTSSSSASSGTTSSGPASSGATSSSSTSTSSSSSASSSDLDLLAAIIYCEAGNQSAEGKEAVGAVVMNRVNSASYPNTISDVIYQSGQFTPAATGTLAKALSSGVPSSCYDAAQAALNGSDPTRGKMSFHAGAGNGTVIDGQTFY